MAGDYFLWIFMDKEMDMKKHVGNLIVTEDMEIDFHFIFLSGCAAKTCVFHDVDACKQAPDGRWFCTEWE